MTKANNLAIYPYIVYCSQAVQHMDKEALDKIITTAKHHNPRFGITGLLVFGSGIFFQWLEGAGEA
jgi:hypothetical protein